MKAIGQMLGNMELPSSNDKRPFHIKQCEWKNAEVGHLNEFDGVECDICKNKGVIYIAEEGNPILMQKPCDCMAKRNSIRYAKQSGLEKLLDHRVASFQIYEEWQKVVKQMAVDYVQEEHHEWFCMLGQSGSGKTHICSAIAKTFIDRSIETKYVIWNTFIREVKADMLSINRMMYQFQKVPVLYIDDFLKGRYTDTDVTIAFDLLNYRYNNSLTTIISSELLFSDIMRIDTAIAGRIKERCGRFFIEIQNSDDKNYRLHSKMK